MKVFKNIYDKINQVLDDVAALLGLEHRAVPVRARSKSRKKKDQK